MNQVSLSFYPSGWRQRLTPDANALTWEGKPVQIVDALRDPSGDARAVATDELKSWLVIRGFAVADWGGGGVFERGRIASIFGVEKEIQVNVGDVEGEVSEVYCRFTLPRRTPPPLAEWAAFVTSLCDRFGMGLGSGNAGVCGEAEFIGAVSAHPNFQDFAEWFGWELPAA